VFYFSLTLLITMLIGGYIAYLLLPVWDGWLIEAKNRYRGKKIATLTFDDGPDEPWTTQVLDVLKEKNLKASFFVLGEKVKKHPEIIKRIFDEGHDVGNHTSSHQKLLLRKEKDLVKDIISTSNEIQAITGELPSLFRAPHGFKRPGLKGILDRLNLRLIPWTKGIWDTDGSKTDRLLKRFKSRFGDLEILLLHDGTDATLTSKDRDATVEMLPSIIEEYKTRGYELKKISEL